MADNMVKLVVEKLGSLIIEEGKMLFGMKDDMKYIKDELSTMNAFLEEAEDTEERAKIKREWVKQVRELAYDVEDCIDEFQRRLVHPPYHGITRRLRIVYHLLSTLKARHYIATEIGRIKSSVDDACNRAQKYGFISTSSSATLHAYDADLSQHPSRLDALFIKDAELVGIDRPRDELLSLLLDGNEAQTCVTSVVGHGGLGKTTLVRRVFNSQRVVDDGSFGNFDCRAWITVSESFELMGFLKKVSQQLFPCDSHEGMDAVQLIQKIRDCLEEKRYVIVFDDIWKIDAWKSIQLFLPDNNKGSRVIVTTRDENVANTCAHDHKHVYKLQPLSHQQSWDLFCRRVFDGPCPDQLKNLSKDILKKCGGLPLVIVTIAGILASKPVKTLDDWKSMLDQLSSGLKNNPTLVGMMSIMALSYNALPYHLKRCFLYLSIFPEDYAINSKRLQRLWIAEGLVRYQQDMTPEEVAESYFKEFISRNMIQPSHLSRSGKVKSCRVHDVMLEFIVSKSMEENLVALHRDHDTTVTPGVIRRLSLHPCEDELPITENSRLDRLRSLLMFVTKLPPQSQRVSLYKSRYLRVLDLHGFYGLAIPDIQAIFKLYHLKYLGLRRTNVSVIPESIARLQNLEMLDIRDSSNFDGRIPVGVVKLSMLRHLRGRSLMLPPGVGSLKALQTLDVLDLSESVGVIRELKNLTQLRKLGVSNLKTENEAEYLCACISEMSSCLRSLRVEFSFNGFITNLDSLASPPLFLQTLKLDGYLGKLPGWIDSLNNVSKITFKKTQLRVDDIQTLQKLPDLVMLELDNGSCSEKELHFSAGGFGCLKHLTVAYPQVTFGVGSMPSLQVLNYVQTTDTVNYPVVPYSFPPVLNYGDTVPYPSVPYVTMPYGFPPVFDYGRTMVGTFDVENLPSLKEVIFTGFHCEPEVRKIIEAHPNKPIITDQLSVYFSDENTSSCSVM